MATNVVALARALNQIERNPEGWDQKTWCGCFAAQVVRGAGYKVNTDLTVSTTSGEELGYVWDVATGLIFFGDSDYHHSRPAHVLFHSDNTVEQIKELVSGYIATEVQRELLESDAAVTV